MGSTYNKNKSKYNGNYSNNGGSYAKYESADDEKILNAESLNLDTTLNEISDELKPGETLILDIGNNYFNQTDEIYDTLVMRGYDVRKSFRNGRNQIIVSRKP